MNSNKGLIAIAIAIVLASMIVVGYDLHQKSNAVEFGRPCPVEGEVREATYQAERYYECVDGIEGKSGKTWWWST